MLDNFAVPLNAQDRILIDFRSILGPLLDPSRPHLESLRASCGVLERSFGDLEPFYLRSYFQVFFGLHFASISDPGTTSKSFKNQVIIRVKFRLRKRLISTLFSIEISRERDAEDKNVDLPKMYKNLQLFVGFLHMSLCQQKGKTTWKAI